VFRMACGVLAFALLLGVLVSPAATGGEKPYQDPDRASRPEFRQLIMTPSTRWLDDGRLVLFDLDRPLVDRHMEVLDPATLRRAPLLADSIALASLRRLLGDSDTPRSLGFPGELHRSGQKGLYVFSGDLFILDIQHSSFRRITETEEEEQSPHFSPDGRKVAFVRTNNLYVVDLDTGTEEALSSDGSEAILNGVLSWVYWEEIYGRRELGYQWAPDSRAIAFYRFDESQVSLQHFVSTRPWTPTVTTQRYPKVGQQLPEVSVMIAEIGRKQSTRVSYQSNGFPYVIRFCWSPDASLLALQTMNRQQTVLDLHFANRKTGKAVPVLRETSQTWINILDDFEFLKDGEHFLWPSERDGFLHLYRYRMDGTLVNRVAGGEWALRSGGGTPSYVQRALVAVDEQNGVAYCTALEKSPLERHLYRVGLDGSDFVPLTESRGTHGISFSPDCRWYLDRHSAIDMPASLRLYRSDGELVETLKEPRTDLLPELELVLPELLMIPARDGFPLPGMILKPREMKAGIRYPVIFDVYGGPSSPHVSDSWQYALSWWNVLADNGYVVMVMDPRSATGISKALEDLVLHNIMGEVELNDLVDAVRWTKTQPFVDSARIGITGASGGGTYTILGMTRSTEFRAGIALSALTDVRFYDAFWGETVMRTEAENPEGFERVSLLRTAGDLHGRLLLVHGTADDNVHIQNVWALVDELIKANKLFELMLYPERKHGIPDRRHLRAVLLDFWKRNL